MGDFFKKDVKTPLNGLYLAAGIRLRIETNSESILEIARQSFQCCEYESSPQRDLRLRLWVEADSFPDRNPKPSFRGLGDLIHCGYDDRSSLLINLRTLCVAGRFTPGLAGNTLYWKAIVFPSLIAIVAPSFGMTSVHSACMSSEGNGLLLAGESGSGKSSLSLALSRLGLDLLSDDRILVGTQPDGAVVWSLSGEMKQRTETSAYFPELLSVKRNPVWDGDSEIRFDPEQLAIKRVSTCKPRWVVFLDRHEKPSFTLEELSREDAAIRLQRDLHQESPQATHRQQLTVQALSATACYRLEYGGDPRGVAARLWEDLRSKESPRPGRPQPFPDFSSHPTSDPLRRFRTTCHRADILLMGRHVRVETDSPAIIRRLDEVFQRFEPAHARPPEFHWRIVAEPRKNASEQWPPLTAFSDGPLRYVHLGMSGFIAVDLDTREAVGSVAAPLCDDRVGFSTVFLASLVHLTAPAFGLTAISAACVAAEGSALLLFGPPNSGKTTTSYWGKKLGLDLYSDQAVFLESISGIVHAWGDFWPAAFRSETAQFLPEIASIGCPFTYGEQTFLCVDKATLSEGRAGSVTPAACIFLERQAASSARLLHLPRQEFARQVFSEAGSRQEHEAILHLLGDIPSYRLLYDDDPSIAARFFRSVLDAHRLMEKRP